MENLVTLGRMTGEHLRESYEHPALHHDNGNNHMIHEVHCYVLIDDFQLDAMVVIDVAQDAFRIAQRVDLRIWMVRLYSQAILGGTHIESLVVEGPHILMSAYLHPSHPELEQSALYSSKQPPD